MKKWLILIIIIFSAPIIGVYVFIPSTIHVSTVRYVKAYQNNVLRFFTDGKHLKEWWHQYAKAEGGYYTKDDYHFEMKNILSNLVVIDIKSPNIEASSQLICLNVYLDSSAIQWSTNIQASNNPFKRISSYKEAAKIKVTMDNLMDAMKVYLDESAHIYGITVNEIKLKDSVLISTKIQTASYPTSAEIYAQVKKLSNFAATQQAIITNSPMLHVQKIDTAHYEAMIGLPINKVIQQDNSIYLKRMPYGGNMLVTEIKGGFSRIEEAKKQLELYYMDSKRASPAIPYELMVTDRTAEPDTTKWITRLYYPVM